MITGNTSQPQQLANMPLYYPHAQHNLTPPQPNPTTDIQPMQPQPAPSTNPTQYYQISPSCMMICFMLPFPFLCLGCCLSQSTKLHFDNTNRSLHLATYCGYCLCCKEDQTINYSDITAIQSKMQYGVYINRQPAFKAVLIHRNGEIELTESMMLRDAVHKQNEIRNLLTSCGVQLKPSVMPMVTVPLNYIM